MRSVFFLLVFTMILEGVTKAQPAGGLLGIVVERYYVADSADAARSKANNLPLGSTTYRVFVDMKAGYRFQAVFGSEGHPMSISTTTSFYNHPVYGNNIANLIYDASLSGGTCMLDSWISAGAASMVHYGVMKSDDDTSGTIINAQGLLQNNGPDTTRPVSQYDGLKKIKPGQLLPKLTTLNMEPLLDALLNSSEIPDGFLFKSENASWACMGGSSHEINGKNRVLIGQFTTSGEFSFNINIQLGKPGGGFEQYVSANPDPGQFVSDTLVFTSQ